VARIDMGDFEEGTEIVRVYLAASLAEAQQVERVLGESGVDYAVEVEEFASRTALGSGGLRRGAGFWVREALVDAAADALDAAGCVAGLVDRGG
jgi:hypothetical protein